MITYRMMRDNFGGGEIQKIRINKKMKTLTLLESYKSDNDIVKHYDVEDVKKHLNKNYFDYCKGCLKIGRKKHYYISTTKGIKEIKNGYVVDVDGVQCGFTKSNSVYVITDILTGYTVDVVGNLWEVYSNLQNFKNKRNSVNEKRLKELRKNFLEEFKKIKGAKHG